MKEDNFVSKFIEIVRDFSTEAKTIRKYDRMSRAMSYQGWMKEPRLYYGFKNLEKRGLIYLKKDGFGFTDKGDKWFQKSSIRYFKLKNKKWDNKWRIVIFDIPQDLNSKRDWFRRKLLNLGFYMIQKSVFVLPYPCEEELGDICSQLDISDYVDIVVADSIGSKEELIRKNFKL